MNTTDHIVEVSTSHGKIVAEDNERDAPILVLIHGNSSCRRVFDRQSESQLGRTYRLITFDLPGHGESDDAIEPERTYTRRGLADAVVEMLGRFGGRQGLILTGTPPVRSGGMAEGFRRPPHAGLAARQDLSAADRASVGRARPGRRSLRAGVRRELASHFPDVVKLLFVEAQEGLVHLLPLGRLLGYPDGVAIPVHFRPEPQAKRHRLRPEISLDDEDQSGVAGAGRKQLDLDAAHQAGFGIRQRFPDRPLEVAAAVVPPPCPAIGRTP